MRLGKHTFLFRAFRIGPWFKRHLGFSSTQPLSVEQPVWNELVFASCYSRSWYLDLWFFMLVLEYRRHVPARHNGVPQ